jgi:hypothetical protein
MFIDSEPVLLNAEFQSSAGVKWATTLEAVGVKLYVAGISKLIFL